MLGQALARVRDSEVFHRPIVRCVPLSRHGGDAGDGSIFTRGPPRTETLQILDVGELHSLGRSIIGDRFQPSRWVAPPPQFVDPVLVRQTDRQLVASRKIVLA